MPEKVRVSPAPTPQLSTGDAEGQAALVLADDEEELPVFDEDDVVELLPDEESDELEVDEVEDESDLALTELLPVERLSFR